MDITIIDNIIQEQTNRFLSIINNDTPNLLDGEKTFISTNDLYIHKDFQFNLNNTIYSLRYRLPKTNSEDTILFTISFNMQDVYPTQEDNYAFLLLYKTRNGKTRGSKSASLKNFKHLTDITEKRENYLQFLNTFKNFFENS